MFHKRCKLADLKYINLETRILFPDQKKYLKQVHIE